MKSKILFLYSGKHPVHLAFAESINADMKKISWKVPRNYDVYITEGHWTKPVVLKKIGVIPKSAKIINLFASPQLYYLDKGFYFDNSTGSIIKYPDYKRRILIHLLQELDGAICVGKLQEDLLGKLAPKISLIRVYSFISEKRWHLFRKNSPNLSSKDILFLGNGPDYYCKGLDLLLNSFSKIYEQNPDTCLNICGNNLEKLEKRTSKGANFLGKIPEEKISRLFSKTSLYCHPGRIDAFPVAVLEALCAGVPVLISKNNGLKEIVQKIDSKLIHDLSEKDLKEKIQQYFKLSLSEKKKISKKCRESAAEFREKVQINNFRKKFRELMKKTEN